ncbi:uroporphyrinogen decarboxylase family protein [Sporomusa sp.]|uniref:uroporphyrinogen decarboxylase family protein n=1 Tax=Sporomusa sp. TaxID=2078658 RepID=UPI002C307D2F|nr:uroporphyrinogen decarboxylase family protein [Sporomusa sp.]HWR42972.1 uroporphyrinogen decarboxylase family protein [Sporomusa sp.]
MKNGQDLYNEHLTRFNKAVALEKTDRTPVMFNANDFCAVQRGVKLSEFSLDMTLAGQTIFDCLQTLGDVDANEFFGAYPPIVGLGNLSKVKFAGRGLPEDMPLQIDEAELLTLEDYDTILDKGFEAFFNDFTVNRLGFDFAEFEAMIPAMIEAQMKFVQAGYVTCSTAMASFEIDYLSGGRTMRKIVHDLFRMPDKLEAVMDVIHDYHINSLRQQIREAKPTTVFTGAGRGACEYYSPKIWDRFVWKYYKKIADMIIEEGAIVQWHMDGNYERGLEYFRDFPKGKCIFCPDGGTDIRKVKEVLGDMMCIRGDVPAAMLVLGTPDEVYKYATDLIKDMGSGFIMSAACMVPMNAKLENVKAMVSAATGK